MLDEALFRDIEMCVRLYVREGGTSFTYSVVLDAIKQSLTVTPGSPVLLRVLFTVPFPPKFPNLKWHSRFPIALRKQFLHGLLQGKYK